MHSLHMVKTDVVHTWLGKIYLNMCHRQDCAGHIPEELIFRVHLKYNHTERNRTLPGNSQEGVDNDADGNNKEVEMIAASLLQQVLLSVHDHCCDLLVLQVELKVQISKLLFFWRCHKPTMNMRISNLPCIWGIWAYHEYEDATKSSRNGSYKDCPPWVWAKKRNQPAWVT